LSRPDRYLQEWEKVAILDAYERGEKIDAIGAEFGVQREYPGRLAKKEGSARRLSGRPPKSSSHFNSGVSSAPAAF